MRIMRFLAETWLGRALGYFVVATTSITILKGYTTPMGSRACSIADVHIISPGGASTYPAGGFAIAKGAFGFRGFDGGDAMISKGGTLSGQLQCAMGPGGNPSTLKLRVFVCSTGAEVATGAAIVDDFIRIIVFGG